MIRDGDGIIIITNEVQWRCRSCGRAAVNLGMQIAIYAELLPLIIEIDCRDVVDIVSHKKKQQNWNLLDYCWYSGQDADDKQEVNFSLKLCLHSLNSLHESKVFFIMKN